MTLKRVVSFVLAFLMTVNIPAALAANGHSKDSGGPHRHTVTLTADTLAGKLLPLESAATSLKDDGNTLRNAEGVVNAQIQGTYYANQTLASVSLAGTSFSFAPLMLDAYFPQSSESPLPSESPDPNASPDPALSPEPTESAEPNASPSPEASAEATERPEATPEIVLSPGYAKTVAQTDVYASASGDNVLGELARNAVVYVASLPNARRAQIVFDTPLGLVEGFAAIKRLENLNEQERIRAVSDAEAQEELRSFQGNPLPCVAGYTPAEASTDTPEPTFSPEPTASETPDATPTPEETASPRPESTEAPTTEEPTSPPEEESTPGPTESPTQTPVVEEPTPSSELTQAPTPTPTQEPTTAPTAEPTQAPVQQPEPEPEPEPAPESEPGPQPEPQPEPESASEPALQKPQAQGRTLLHWLFPAAFAEENRPSSITGQRVGGRARSAGGGVSAVVYPGLFDAVTDVRLSALTTGVKEDIVVHQYTGNHVYAYRLTTEDLTARQSGQEIILYNGDGQALAKLEAPHMTDASGSRSTDIAVSLEGSGGSYTVTYRPNDEWMQAAAYPVTIDPTGSYFNDLATGIGDVYVSSANPGRHYDHTVVAEALSGITIWRAPTSMPATTAAKTSLWSFLRCEASRAATARFPNFLPEPIC